MKENLLKLVKVVKFKEEILLNEFYIKKDDCFDDLVRHLNMYTEEEFFFIKAYQDEIRIYKTDIPLRNKTYKIYLGKEFSQTIIVEAKIKKTNQVLTHSKTLATLSMASRIKSLVESSDDFEKFLDMCETPTNKIKL